LQAGRKKIRRTIAKTIPKSASNLVVYPEIHLKKCSLMTMKWKR